MLTWFSPEERNKSSICDFTNALKSELSEAFMVKYFGNETHCIQPSLPIYNIGNNYDEHNLIWWNSYLNPGIIILHDIELKDFYRKAFIVNKSKKFYEKYISKCLKYFSSDKRLYDNVNEIEDLFPYYEFALFKAKHVIVHNDYAFELLDKSDYGNKTKINLCYNGKTNPSLNKTLLPHKKVKLIIFGHVGNNRYVEELYQTLLINNMFEKFELHIVGHVTNEISQFLLDKEIVYHGYVDNIDALLQEMDIAINIRFPSVGESSQSLLQCWANKLPCIIRNTKSYSCVSSEVAFCLKENFSNSELLSLLQYMISNPCKVNFKTEKAFNHLIEKHSPVSYVEQLFNLISTDLKLSECYKDSFNHHNSSICYEKWCEQS